VLVVLTAGGKVFFESYFAKSALGTGYSFKPVKDGNAVDASNTKKIILHNFMMPTNPSAYA
jgi:hypothetical protein